MTIEDPFQVMDQWEEEESHGEGGGGGEEEDNTCFQLPQVVKYAHSVLRLWSGANKLRDTYSSNTQSVVIGVLLRQQMLWRLLPFAQWKTLSETFRSWQYAFLSLEPWNTEQCLKHLFALSFSRTTLGSFCTSLFGPLHRFTFQELVQAWLISITDQFCQRSLAYSPSPLVRWAP